MPNDFLRREWGAVAFVVITALGMIVVPVALSLNKQNTGSPIAPAAVVSPSPAGTPTAAASASPSGSPAASPSPSASETPSPSASPAPSESPSAPASPAASPTASTSP